MNELGTQQPPFFISHIFNVGLRAFPKTETLSTKRHEIRKRVQFPKKTRLALPATGGDHFPQRSLTEIRGCRRAAAEIVAQGKYNHVCQP
jgi:hypothetical protein